MPLLTDGEVIPQMRTPMGTGLAQDKDGPSAVDTLSAAFRQENVIASAIDAVRPGFVTEEDHNPLDIIKDTQYEANYLDNFIGSRSEAETKSIMSRIDREEKDRETLASAGGWGMAAAAFAGIADPTVLLPMGPVIKSARGGAAALKTAASTAAMTGGIVAAQEGALQSTQELRTFEESALAIGTGTLLGGILGGAISGLSKAEVATLTAKLDDVRSGLRESTFQPVSEVGAARSVDRGTGELEGALGAEKALSSFSPVTRLQTSVFDEARNIGRDLGDAGLSLRENRSGIPTSDGGTVETRVKMWLGGLGDAIETMDDAYAKYWFGASKFAGRQRARIASEWSRYSGKTGGRLTAQEFRQEVGKAMARTDAHQIPEVEQVAKQFRAKVFDPLKDAAVRAGLLPEDVKALGAPSYLTRVYNRERIIAQRDRFTQILTDHFRARGLDDLSEAELRDVVDSITDTIIGNTPFRIAGLDIVQGPRGPLKERVLDVPDGMIEEFLERDIEIVSRLYTRTMSADVELATKFGDTRLEQPLNKLRDEFNRRIAKAKTDKERTKLQDQYEAARADVEALRDRIRHTYALPDDINGIIYRAAKVGQQLNYLRLLGGMTLSAIPDLGRPVMVYGLTKTLRDGWLPLVSNFKATRIAAKEVKKAGAALDMVLDTRARSIADLFDDWQRGSKFERALEGLSSRYGLVSLMAPWNAAMKQMVGTIAMNDILQASKAVNAGKATAKQIKSLAASGIDEAMAKRIWGQFENGGGSVERGLHLANTEDWADRKAIEAFRAAVVREADRVVVTPGLELPLWISKPLGKMIGQFKSFALSSTQRTFLAGLQQKDLAFINGTLLTLGLGGLATWVRAQTSGYDTSKWTSAKWATESVDRSGLLTIFSEINNIAEKVTRGRVGLSAFTGEMASRYQSRNAVGALTGPSFGLASDIISITGSAFAGDWAATDTRAVRSILPYQNIFYIRKLLDQVENGVNSAFGVPQRKSN